MTQSNPPENSAKTAAAPTASDAPATSSGDSDPVVEDGPSNGDAAPPTEEAAPLTEEAAPSNGESAPPGEAAPSNGEAAPLVAEEALSAELAAVFAAMTETAEGESETSEASEEQALIEEPPAAERVPRADLAVAASVDAAAAAEVPGTSESVALQPSFQSSVPPKISIEMVEEAPRSTALFTAEDLPAPPSRAAPRSVRSLASESHDPGHLKAEPRGKYLLSLALGAIGVVYGDIGTSPLYAVRECFHGGHGVALTESNVYGVLSLIFWSLTLIISVKYLLYVLRADNKGEGGILALMALVSSSLSSGRGRIVAAVLGVVGAGLLYGDGAITPAISVLSAVEGLGLAAPSLKPLVLPLTAAILVCVFAFQYRGTARVGAVFGPIMVVWFVVLAILGVANITRHPSVLLSLSPTAAFTFLLNNGALGLATLGAVFLVVTGGEALYADLGHFGRKPIRFAWFLLVGPALLLNYLGQGALLLDDPSAIESPFFRQVPPWGLYPLVALSTAASVIASQALISGVFSMTRQATMLGFLPRINVQHTSAHERGQIYVPTVNWMLMLATIGLVFGFGSSSAMASAYGVAVTLTMLITTILSYKLARRSWGWSRWRAGALSGLFLLPESIFVWANLSKLQEGGWVALLVAALLFIVMTTWQRGRGILARRFREQHVPLTNFFERIKQDNPGRVPGTVVFMTSSLDGTPPALLRNYQHNHVVHERVILLSVVTGEAANVTEAERGTVEQLEHGFSRVIARYGFMEQPDIPALLLRTGVIDSLQQTSFFLGRETMIVSEKSGMSKWRVVLFTFLSSNAQSATKFFNIPPDRVMEIGAQVVL